MMFLAVLIGVSGVFIPHARGKTEWSQAVEPRRWTFPRDYGAHPEYRTEWWYFTGNLVDDLGFQYGYQLTFFRQGIRKKVGSAGNPWSIRDIYFAHFTITDVKEGCFKVAERISRAGPGLAGALMETMKVWIFDWSATMEGPVIFLEAKKGEMELTLKLIPRKPLVFHGENGLSKKGAREGQASYYTSFTDLETQGFLKTHKGGALTAVKGTSWFDHEFGSNQLNQNQEGWDWFSLHLADGKDLMIYLIRRKDGSTEAESSGTLVEPGKISHHLDLRDISVTVLGRWKSPRSGGNYPSRWRIRVLSFGIDLYIEPVVADQELNMEEPTGIIYWEGAVRGKGTSEGRNVICDGYVELTGYSRSLGGIF